MDPHSPTTDRLRHEIDQGRGDKAPFPDPAASPLGTDEEAAGTPPSDAAIRTAASHELKREGAGGGNTDERGRSAAGGETNVPGGMKGLLLGMLAFAAVALGVLAWMS